MKRKLKIIFSVLITGFFLFLALGSDDDSDCPPELKDKKCEWCGSKIGCNGYTSNDGLVLGPSGNGHYCRACAQKRADQF